MLIPSCFCHHCIWRT